MRDRVENAVGVDVIQDGTQVYLAGGISSWAPGGKMFAAVVAEAQEAMKRRKAEAVF